MPYKSVDTLLPTASSQAPIEDDAASAVYALDPEHVAARHDTEQRRQEIRRLHSSVGLSVKELLYTLGVAREVDRIDAYEADRVERGQPDFVELSYAYAWTSDDGEYEWRLNAINHPNEPLGKQWQSPLVISYRKAGANAGEYISRMNLTDKGLQLQDRYEQSHVETFSDDKKTFDQLAMLRLLRAELDAVQQRVGNEKMIVVGRLATAAAENRMKTSLEGLAAVRSQAVALYREALNDGFKIAERSRGPLQRVWLQASDMLMRRLKMTTDFSGKEYPIIYGDDPASYVETDLGTDAKGRAYKVLHNHRGKEGSLGILPDMMVVRDEHGVEIYEITREGRVRTRKYIEDTTSARQVMHERLSNLNLHLEALLRDGREEGPLRHRLMSWFEAEAIKELHIGEMRIIDDEVLDGKITDEGNQFSITLRVLSAQGGPMQLRRLVVPKDHREQMYEIGGRDDRSDIVDLVSDVLDRTLHPIEAKDVPVEESAYVYEDAQLVISDILHDHGLQYQLRREPSIAPDVSRVLNGKIKVEKQDGDVVTYHIQQYGMLGHYDQIRPLQTRITIERTDRKGDAIDTNAYVLTHNQFVPATQPGQRLSNGDHKAAEKVFEELAQDLLDEIKSREAN